MGEVIGLVAVTLIFGWPVVKILTNHHARITEMRLNHGGGIGDNALLSEIRDLKDQVNDLRDTTTRYDISFDAALQRMESRVSGMEQRMSTVERQVQPSPEQARIGGG